MPFDNEELKKWQISAYGTELSALSVSFAIAFSVRTIEDFVI